MPDLDPAARLTPKKNLPVPVHADGDNPVRDFRALGFALDDLPGPTEAMTTAQRDALPPAQRYKGRTIYNDTTDQVQLYNGATWEPFAPAPAPSTQLAYTAGVLTTVTEKDAGGATTATTTLTYTAGVLTSVVEQRGAKTTTTTLSYTSGVLSSVTVA